MARIEQREDERGTFLAYVFEDGREFHFDEEDRHHIGERNWRLYHTNKHNWYAAYATAKGRLVLFHRVVTGMLRAHIDHADANSLNNRKYNLRRANHSLNAANKRNHRKSTTGYRGVYPYKGPKGKFIAAITVRPKPYTILGFFDDAEKAARCRDLAAYLAWGEFAVLNFPVTS